LLLRRNALIYFNHEAQKHIVTYFHFALRDASYLFLGEVEVLLTHASLFSLEHVRARGVPKLPPPNFLLREGETWEFEYGCE
jgi:two-component system CheB/CheR fusion protein